MERKELLNQLDSKNIGNLYCVFGRESYLIEEIVSLFKKQINPDMSDFNLSIIDGKEINLEEFRSAVETVPFLDEKRISIIKDFELLNEKKRNFSDTDEDEVINIIGNIPSSTVLVFVNYGGIEKRRRIYKAISKYGACCELNKMKDFELFDWVKNLFEQRKAKIQNTEISYFIEVSGYRDRNSNITLSDLKKEIEKLSSYAGRDLITKEIINNLSTSKIENDIFKLIDMIGSKNPQKAYRILEDMINSGESILGIFAMLYRQFNNIAKVKSLIENNVPMASILNQTQMTSYVYQKVSRQAKNYDDESLFEIIGYISDYDFKIKNGLIKDSLAAEIFIAKYCS